MSECLLGRDVLEFGPCAASERAARPRHDERVDLLRLAPFEALEERGVLAVDRQDPPSPTFARGECELAGCNEALLVRQREIDAALQRPERRVHAGEAHDGVEHDVGLRLLEQLGQVASDRLQRRVDVVERSRSRSCGAELEPGMSLDDLDRLAADRAGCAKERDALHPASVRAGTPSGMRARRNTPPVQRRAIRRCGRAFRRVRRAAFPCP